MRSVLKRFKITLYVLLSSLLLSCQDDNHFDSSKSEEEFVWAIKIDSQPITKGQPVISVSDTIFKSFGLYSYYYDESFDSYNVTPYMTNEIVSRDSQENWRLENNIFWPQNSSLSFFAYYPYLSGNENNGMSFIINNKEIPFIQYSMPVNIEDQPDIMIATAQEDLFQQTVPITFKHTLACIGFSVKSDVDSEVEYIAVTGISTSGQISLNYTGGDIYWNNLSGTNDSVFYIGLKPNSIATNTSQNITAVDGYLMAIPQSLTIDSKLIIKYSNQSTPKEVNLKTDNVPTWQPGYKYNYNVNRSDDVFSVTINNNDVTYLGGELIFSISSQKTSGTTTENIGWTTEIIYPEGTTDHWLSGDISDNTGGLNIMKSLDAYPSIGNPLDVTDQDLRNATPVSDLNLSLDSNNTYTTANCYLVNAPGTYKFLCNVMGNGFNGASGITKNNLNGWNCYGFGKFKDYNGNYINQLGDLYIDTSGAKAQLIWEDSYGLITDLSISDNYINFTVPQNSIVQGNAIIAIVNSDNKIMWSWHIWVTTYKLGTNQYINPANLFMARNIGSCSESQISYPARTAQIKFTQLETGKIIVVDVTQQAADITNKENSVLYQWGRKDPMVGTTGELLAGSLTEYAPKDTYGTRTYDIRNAGNGVPLDSGILNPNIFYSSINSDMDYRWCSDPEATLWGEMKTIYDPSPVGYRVSPYYTMSNFTYTNPGQTATDYWSSVGLLSLMQSNSSNYIFLYACGKIDNSGKHIDYSSKGYYWAPQNNSNNFYCLYFMQYESGNNAAVYCGNNVSINGTYIYQQTLTNGVSTTSSGMPIRPVTGN